MKLPKNFHCKIIQEVLRSEKKKKKLLRSKI